jgi:hypothetical protein
MRVIFASLLLLGACQTAEGEARGRTVVVRMSAGSQTMAERACGGPARPVETRQGANEIVYRCLEEGS